MNRRLGVCSWSLKPASPEDLAQKVRAAGLSWVQLALDPIRRGEWDEAKTVKALAAAGIGIASGMMGMAGEDYSTLESIRLTGGVRPDTTWEKNLRAARDNAKLAARLQLTLVTFHAGFIPHDHHDRGRGAVIGRVGQIAHLFGEKGVQVGLETGQESAQTLIDVLDDLPGIGVNFDPANMILYGMGEPVAALRALAGRVVQVHIKDATPAAAAGEWGRDVRMGTGAVDWPGFFEVIRGVPCDLMIEREAGEDRVADVAAARRLVEGMV